ncbi:MAG TPA: cytochrome o ubiquinol oxidase subunit III [Kiloniellaceae bacterium]|nr:cytochrome o ubiquinol oxidase subunit III [Kiloniellaceae bacterium]
MTLSTATARATEKTAAEEAGFENRAFGFWLYLMSDAVIFALLFATYMVMVGNTAGGPDGKALFSLTNAFAETMLLLCSSITFGFASLALVARQRAAVQIWLLVTFILGAGFIALEIREFTGLVAQGAGPDRSGFLSSFFSLVGTHGLHVSFGLIFLAVMLLQVTLRGLTPQAASRLYRLGLFWHFLDIVWIGIFSIVYLPGVL